jgi:hypothetical protein
MYFSVTWENALGNFQPQLHQQGPFNRARHGGRSHAEAAATSTVACLNWE